ncbi:MAG: hypothetical protein Q4E53_04445 [Eubacteriales bacterium]|nr:hypothetical protein [Eubacteriales bacterium]
MGNIDRLIDAHFHKKPGERVEVLKERYERISVFHKDPLTAALLATSYYGMEELTMRLPRLNDILRNPFAKEEQLHAITGLILVADGGPAEGAKAIQLSMALSPLGVDTENTKTSHLMALIAIACKQIHPFVREMEKAMQKGLSFENFAMNWLKEEQKRQEISAEETDIAYSLLVGMKEEVETVFDEEL